MNRSVYWEELSDLERRVLEGLGLGPGYKLYIRKLCRLPNATLAARVAEHSSLGLGPAAVVEAVAEEFGRRRKTISGRIARLHLLDRHATLTTGGGSFSAGGGAK